MKFSDLTALVGNTPIVPFVDDQSSGGRIWVKLEGANPTGSIKDRACLYNIRGAQERGELQSGMTLLEASSGNMACALAYFGAIFGYPVEVVCNSKLTADKAAFIRYFGARLMLVGDFTIQGNRHCRDVLKPGDPDRYCFLDQLHNWDNPRSHYESTGPEIVRDCPEVAAVVGSLGSGGAMNGIGRYVKQAVPAARVICVEAASGTKLPGTGAFDDGDYVTPFIRQGYEEQVFDRCIKVTEDEARHMTREAARQGLFCGLQTGGVLHAATVAVRELGITGDVVAISGDSGWKNMSVLMPS
jgi:cysteine synthase